MNDFQHISVLPEETLNCLLGEQPGLYLDCTLGGGGHTTRILESHPENRVIGLDVDTEALAHTTRKLAPYGERFRAIRCNFGELGQMAEQEGIEGFDGILMDIGVSSHQIDTGYRGFSYREDGPLDMRMDNRLQLTASMILNKYEETELRRIFRVYGEEKFAGKIAKAIVARREEKPWERTKELADLLVKVYGFKKDKTPAPARVFQALRIAVNKELEVLENGLESAFNLLKPGGQLAVITFHSLEDRIVKHFFKDKSEGKDDHPDMPIAVHTVKAEGKLLTRKPIVATEEERKINPRSNCAKLRAIKKFKD